MDENGAKRTKRSEARNRIHEEVAVKIGEGTTYANVLKDLKTKGDPQKMGIQVREIRKTRVGKIPLELRNGGKIKEQEETVATVLGQGASACTFNWTTSLVVKDLDRTTEKAEMVEAIKTVAAEHDKGFIEVRSLRKTFGETQAAVVATTATMPSRAAEVIAKKGELKIGWVTCRARESVKIVRYFPCLGFGHKAREYKERDRTNIFRLCGEIEHRAKDCKSNFLCAKRTKNPREQTILVELHGIDPFRGRWVKSENDNVSPGKARQRPRVTKSTPAGGSRKRCGSVVSRRTIQTEYKNMVPR